jgi:hypothetical protein
MKALTLIAALFLGIVLVIAAPVADIGLVSRGNVPKYNKDTKIIVATEYIVTEDEFLYEVKCDRQKWHKDCDYSVEELN